MKVLLNGQEVTQVDDLRVIYDERPEEDEQLHMVVTPEGIILDVVVDQGDSDETTSVERTMSIDVDGLDSFCK